MTKPVAVLLVVTSVAAGFAAGSWVRGRDADESLADLRAENARLRARIGADPARPPALEPSPPPRPTPIAPDRPSVGPGASAGPASPRPAAEPEEAAAARAPSAPRIPVAGYEAALSEADWSVVGESVNRMLPLLGPFAEEWARTGELPADLIGKIQQANGPLLASAMKAGKKMGLKNPNDAFTHPVFQANLIAVALAAAGKPLSEAQVEAVRRVAEAYVERDRSRVSRYDDSTPALRRTLDDALLRDEFYERAFAVLSAEQREALQPAATKGRLGVDLFSSALLWQTRCQVLPFTTRETLAADMERRMFEAMALPETARPAVHDAVAEWAAAWPRETIEAPADPISLRGMVPGDSILEAARREIALLQRLTDLGRFDDVTTGRIRAIDFVLVPVRAASGG
jgi:hypothetical protein